MWRRLLILLAVFVGAILGCVVALTSPRVAKNVEERLELLARENGVALTMDGLAIELMPPAVVVRGLAIGGDAGGPPTPVVAAEEIRALVRPWPSPTGVVVIDDLEVRGLTMDAPRLAEIGEGRQEEAAGEREPARGRRSPIDVRAFRLTGGSVTFVVAERRVEASGIGIEMRPRDTRGRDLSLTVERGLLFEGEERLEFTARAAGVFEGTLDKPHGLTLQDLHLALPHLDTHVTGGVDLQPAIPKLSLRATSSAELQRVARLFEALPPMKGEAALEAELDGSLHRLRARLKAAVKGLDVFGKQLGDVSFDVSWNGGKLVGVTSVALEHPRAGKVTASGTVELSDGVPISLTGRLHRASLPDILELTGLPDAWVDLVFTGDVRANGTVQRLGLDLEVDGDVERFYVFDRSYRAADPERMLSLSEVSLRGRARVGERNVSLEEVQLGLRGATYRVDGGLAYDTQVGMDLRVASAAADLAALGPIAGLALAGRGELAAAVEGPYEDAHISGTANLQGLAVAGIGIGDARGTLIYSHPTLRFDRVAVRRHEGTMSGSGAIHFEEELRAEGAVSLDKVELGGALRDIGLPAELASRFRARVSGSATIDGPLLLPRGTAELHTAMLRVDGVDMGAAEATCGFGEGDEVAWGQITLEPQGGEADARVAWRKDETLALSANVAQVPVGLISPFIGAIPMTGTVSGRAKLAGKPGTLIGSASAKLRDWTVYDVRMETSRLEADFTATAVSIEANLLSGDAHGAALISIAPGLPHSARLTFEGLDFNRLMPFSSGSSVALTGEVRSTGQLTEPDSLTADLIFDAVKARFGDVTLTSQRQVTMHYAGEVLELHDAALSGSSAQVTVGGKLPVAGPMSLRLRGTSGLQVASMLSPRVRDGQGRVDFDVRVGGRFPSPTLDGELQIAKGRLGLTNTRQAIEDIEARLSFSGRTLSLESATAKLGGGAVRAVGVAILGAGEESELNLRAELDGVALAPAPETTASITGNLSLQGPLHDLLLSGRVRLDSLRYGQNVDLTAIIPSQVARPLHVPAIEPTEVVRLAVSVTAPNNIIVSNNVLEGEFRADLTVTGTSNRVGLMGSVTPLWARARYNENVFEVARASIDFTEEYKIFTQFDIRATTQACGIDVVVNIFGDSSNYNVVPAGTDDRGSVDPQDVLVCLQFGLRLRDFEGHGAAAMSSLGSTLSGGLDALWTVSGMDEKVKRVLPIELDEVRLTSGWSSRLQRNLPRILVGKELGKNLEIKASRAIEDASDYNFSLEYRLSNVATVQGTWLSVSDVPIADFGLDLKLRWEFR